ncbi:MAG: T9SS type A sorting domain-containing protein [Bacteroidales bacterium]|jgi:hypothetical protein|nr:T9SS type A sorting domain-containing protein [Bacteroidales bacterium]
MKKQLLLFLALFVALSLYGQRDTTSFAGAAIQRDTYRDPSSIKINIYPVPVRENKFTVKTDRDISFVKVTNIIGQDIYKKQYNNPLQMIDVLLENPKRGMYLVTLVFSDGIRVVKKIMVEETE